MGLIIDISNPGIKLDYGRYVFTLPIFTNSPKKLSVETLALKQLQLRWVSHEQNISSSSFPGFLENGEKHSDHFGFLGQLWVLRPLSGFRGLH